MQRRYFACVLLIATIVCSLNEPTLANATATPVWSGAPFARIGIPSPVDQDDRSRLFQHGHMRRQGLKPTPPPLLSVE